MDMSPLSARLGLFNYDAYYHQCTHPQLIYFQRILSPPMEAAPQG